MTNFKTLLRGVALGGALALPAAAQDAPDADTVLARVGDVEITLGHIIAAVPGLTAEEQQLPADVLLEGLVERLVQQAAVATASTETSRQVELNIENERRALIAADVVDDLAAEIEVTEEAIQDAYDARFAEFTPPPEYWPSHILVETEDEAKALVEELGAGADFAELAKEKSTGPSGPGGGDLGWTGLGRMVPSFEEAMVALEAGEISDPVETQFGWHVIKMNEIRQPDVPTIDSMRGELEAEVWRLSLRNSIGEIVDGVEIQRTDLSTIDPAIISDLQLIQN